MQNKKLSFETNNPPVVLKLGKKKTELLKDKALRGRKS